jgi:hypothetical protein
MLLLAANWPTSSDAYTEPSHDHTQQVTDDQQRPGDVRGTGCHVTLVVCRTIQSGLEQYVDQGSPVDRKRTEPDGFG